MIYSLHGVGKQFSKRQAETPALAGITFEVGPGETLALLGPSGAGKTTLFRLLNATLRPTSGSLLFDGADTAALTGGALRTMRRRVGTIYQQHNLVPSLTAFENTLCGALGRMSLLTTFRSIFRPTKIDADRAMQALEQVGLKDKRYARADELSGGQQQRLAVARVLMQSPDVILADEPTASLDPALAESITSLLAELARSGKRTLIMAVHKVDLATRYFPRTIGLRAGGVSFDMPVRELHPELLSTLYSGEKPSGPRNGDNLHHKLGCAR